MRIAVLVPFAFVLGACAGGADTASQADPIKTSATCLGTPPKSCPATVPSYKTDVIPVLTAKCNNCHVGGRGPWPLTNHTDIVDWLPQIQSDVEHCSMPPTNLDGGVALTAEERELLLGWALCGAPNN
jgi:hypothetical protein